MADSNLYPIVMAPLSEPPFQCAGNGLLHQGHSRASISDLRAWLFPKRKNTAPLSRPKAWWQAQLVLYDLGIPKKSETIASLRARLEAAVLGGRCDALPPDIAQTEARLNQTFLQANARCRRERLLQSGGTEEDAMAMENPRLFLQQKFFKSSINGGGLKQEDEGHICVLKRLDNGDRAAVHSAASSLGLHTVSADAPGSRGYGSRWLVVGRDREAVWSEKHKIDAQTAALQEQERAAKRQKLEEDHARYLLSRNAANPRVSKHNISTEGGSRISKGPTGKAGSVDDPCADLKGKWHITCEYIDEQWPDRHGSHPLSLYVYRENDPVNDEDEPGYGSGSASEIDSESSGLDEGHGPGDPGRLMGKFDFRVVQGLMKFSKDQSAEKLEQEKKTKKRKKVESLTKEKLPFRWRGSEVGTGEVLYDSNGDQKGCIVFDGPAGKLSGSFYGWHGKCAISGFKLSDEVPAHARDDDWDDYSESAYEHARVSRWH